MEYNSQLELYHALLPAFGVAQRILRYRGINVRNEEIWIFLSRTKWKYDVNLTISEMVNDIISFEGSDVYER